MASVRAVVFDADSRLLLLRRAASTSRPNQWNLGGGRIENGESLEVAVCREVFEETGLTVSPIRVLQVFETQTYILCQLLTPCVDVKLTPKESSSFTWVHPSELLKIGFIADLKQLRSVFRCLGIEIPFVPEFEANPRDSL